MAGTDVTYNGQSNNLTGQGSPNPTKLTLPNLNQIADPATQTALLKIQQYINNLVAPTGSGGYESLTGPGETETPGALTQAGQFTVNADDPGSGGITLSSIGNPSILESSDGSGNDSEFNASEGTAAISASTAITVETPGTLTMSAESAELQAPSGVLIRGEYVEFFTAEIQFFGESAAVPQQTVTGSKAGNAALASLLAALADYGLVVDDTT